MNEELPFISSSPILATAKPKVQVQDEIDLPTLVKVQALLQAEIEAYSLTDRLTIDETNFTVKQQLAMNKSIALSLKEIKLTVDAAITNVREKYSE
jgi:hypothetical protein